MSRTYSIGIVGATGAVGQELLKILAERKFPLGELRLLASERSMGKTITYQGCDYTVGLTDENAFGGLDIVFFAGGAASKLYAEAAVAAGVVVIDNGSSFRSDPNVPLLVPEVNPEAVRWHKGVIANPNCSTIQLAVALKPLHEAAQITRIIIATYQAVSGAGAAGIDELEEQSAQALAGQPLDEPQVFQHQIAFNLLPHIDVFQENDYTKEEMKLVTETRKIFNDETIGISATCVRVPVYRSHAEAVTIETAKPLCPVEARRILAAAPGIVVLDDPANNLYPMPVAASDTDDVYVGRIRQDLSCANGLNLWIVADQLRKGAATNAVQIAELLVAENLVK
jgi:aspartate-semialdehyde dehydrogenase